jgi:hypothetical protein
MRSWFKSLDKNERMALVQAMVRGIGTGATSAIMTWLIRAL